MLCYSSIVARALGLTQATVMAEFAGNPLPSWQDLAASNGFGVLCLRFPEGERFTFIITDPPKVREHGLRAIEVLLLESELRAHLALAHFSETTVEESVRVARTWATSTTASLLKY